MERRWHLRASVRTGLLTICTMGWLLVGGLRTARAEATQAPTRGPEKPASSRVAVGQDLLPSAKPIPIDVGLPTAGGDR